MKNLFESMSRIYPSPIRFNFFMLFFRIAISIELICVHGLKKIGVGTATAEIIPNPLSLPHYLNSGIAISANLFFPLLIIVGYKSRYASLPILAVTLTGFVLHWNSPALVRDVPFVYSLAFLAILFLGPGEYSFDFMNRNKIAS